MSEWSLSKGRPGYIYTDVTITKAKRLLSLFMFQKPYSPPGILCAVLPIRIIDPLTVRINHLDERGVSLLDELAMTP